MLGRAPWRRARPGWLPIETDRPPPVTARCLSSRCSNRLHGSPPREPRATLRNAPLMLRRRSRGRPIDHRSRRRPPHRMRSQMARRPRSLPGCRCGATSPRIPATAPLHVSPAMLPPHVGRPQRARRRRQCSALPCPPLPRIAPHRNRARRSACHVHPGRRRPASLGRAVIATSIAPTATRATGAPGPRQPRPRLRRRRQRRPDRAPRRRPDRHPPNPRRQPPTATRRRRRLHAPHRRRPRATTHRRRAPISRLSRRTPARWTGAASRHPPAGPHRPNRRPPRSPVFTSAGSR